MDQSEVTGYVNSAIDIITEWGLQVLGAIAVFIIGRWIAAKLRNGVVRAMERGKVDATLIPFLSGAIYYAALAVVIIAVLGLFGIETTSLVAVLGAAGLAIGLALQGTLSNFSAGVMLLVFRPFKQGDAVVAGGETGLVREIGIFTTIIDTFDNVKIIVPNSTIYGSTIKNISAYDTRRNDMVVGVSYDDDLGLAQSVIRRVCESDERVMADPPLQVEVSELGDSSVNFVVRPWCAASDYWPLRFDLTRRIKEELEAAGCSIPFPQRDIHLFNSSDNEDKT